MSIIFLNELCPGHTEELSDLIAAFSRSCLVHTLSPSIIQKEASVVVGMGRELFPNLSWGRNYSPLAHLLLSFLLYDKIPRAMHFIVYNVNLAPDSCRESPPYASTMRRPSCLCHNTVKKWEGSKPSTKMPNSLGDSLKLVSNMRIDTFHKTSINPFIRMVPPQHDFILLNPIL